MREIERDVLGFSNQRIRLEQNLTEILSFFALVPLTHHRGAPIVVLYSRARSMPSTKRKPRAEPTVNGEYEEVPLEGGGTPLGPRSEAGSITKLNYPISSDLTSFEP